jgi:hypothetical protein
MGYDGIQKRDNNRIFCGTFDTYEENYESIQQDGPHVPRRKPEQDIPNHGKERTMPKRTAH